MLEVEIEHKWFNWNPPLAYFIILRR